MEMGAIVHIISKAFLKYSIFENYFFVIVLDEWNVGQSIHIIFIDFFLQATSKYGILFGKDFAS